MKRNISLPQLWAIFLIALTLGLQSCNRDDHPVTPSNEVTDKGHGEWAKVEFIFKEGHLHGETFHGDPDYPDHIKYFKRTQKITFSYNKEGNVVADTDQPIYFLGGNSYALIINYYNNKGELMNHEFIDGDMAKIHQHFFYAQDVVATKAESQMDTTKPYLFNYVYRDTDPYDQDYNPKSDEVKIRKRQWDASNPSAKDPIGLKGYITIPSNTYYQKFNLKVVLAHFKVDNKLNKNTNQPYHFNDKVNSFFSASDLSLEIPVNIYSSINLQETEELKRDYFFPDAAAAFNATVEEIEEMYNLIFELDPEGSPFWL